MFITGFPSPAARHSGAYRRFRPIGAQAPNAGKPRADGLRGLAAGVLAGLFGLCLALAAGCRHEPPEAALRQTIASMQKAAEAHDTSALFEPIAADFVGSEGMDRTAFRRYVTLMGMQHKSVGVSLGPMEVKLFGDRATVTFTAAITGGAGFLPDQGQVYDIDTGWRMEGSDWKLISAHWKEKL
jgi:hypothetical protein